MIHGHIKIKRLSIDGNTVVQDFERRFDSVAGMHAAFKDAGLSQRIGLVGCAAQKATGACKAKDLYTSNLFRAARAYVEATCVRWYILSAKFGLLDPERVIEPYDVRLGAERVRWGERVGRQLDEAVPYPAQANATIVCLAGATYAGAISLPDDRELHWEEPLAGMGLGQRIQWLKENTP